MDVVDRTRGWIYDAAIVRMTAAWYRAVLTRLPRGCRLLDIGIGTGSALLANADLLVANDLHVTGVDVDGAYVARCQRAVTGRGLGQRIAARRESIYDHRGGPYDAAYFSASFMLLPDPPAALRHVGSLIVPRGRFYFTQTFEHRPSRTVERLKPLLHMLTTIDFGRVTYERDFRQVLHGSGMTIEEFETLHAGARRSAVLAVASPAPGTAGGPPAGTSSAS